MAGEQVSELSSRGSRLNTTHQSSLDFQERIQKVQVVPIHAFALLASQEMRSSAALGELGPLSVDPSSECMTRRIHRSIDSTFWFENSSRISDRSSLTPDCREMRGTDSK